MRKRGLKNQGLKAVCTLEAAIQENVVVKIRECNAASQEVRRVFRSRRQRPAIKCAWPAPQAARCRGTQAPRLCRFGKFDSPERVMRLDFVSFGGFITASTTHPCYGIRAFYGIRGLVLIFCNDPFLIRIDQHVPELRVGQYQSAICPVGLH